MSLQRKTLIFHGTLSMTLCTNVPRITLWETAKLCYYDPDLPVSIETDASQSGISAVLLQNGRPISFMSKALTETQSRYSNIEHEF